MQTNRFQFPLAIPAAQLSTAKIVSVRLCTNDRDIFRAHVNLSDNSSNMALSDGGFSTREALFENAHGRSRFFERYRFDRIIDQFRLDQDHLGDVFPFLGQFVW